MLWPVGLLAIFCLLHDRKTKLVLRQVIISFHNMVLHSQLCLKMYEYVFLVFPSRFVRSFRRISYSGSTVIDMVIKAFRNIFQTTCRETFSTSSEMCRMSHHGCCACQRGLMPRRTCLLITKLQRHEFVSIGRAIKPRA